MHPDSKPLAGRGETTRAKQFKNWLRVKLLSPLCLAASLFQQEGGGLFIYFVTKLDQVQRKASENEWHQDCVHDVGI